MDAEDNILDLPEELDNIIHLTDENGADVSFEFLDLIEHEGGEYVVLLPAGQAEAGDGEVVILRLEESGDETTETYVGIEDEDTLNAVFAIFREKFQDDFNFVD